MMLLPPEQAVCDPLKMKQYCFARKLLQLQKPHFMMWAWPLIYYCSQFTVIFFQLNGKRTILPVTSHFSF